MGTALAAVLLAISAHLAPPTVEASDFTNSDLRTIAVAYAQEYGINSDAFIATLAYESKFNPKERGDYVHGVATSFGMCQFHKPVRDWGITIAQADSPLFCMDKMARYWQKGEKARRKWTGYKLYKLYGPSQDG